MCYYSISLPNSSRKAISNNGFLFLGELDIYLSGSFSVNLSLCYYCHHSNPIVSGNFENFSSIIYIILIIFLFIFEYVFL